MQRGETVALKGLLRPAVIVPVALALAVPSASAQESNGSAASDGEPPVAVSVVLEPTTATVGDRLRLSVVLESDPGVAVSFPDVAESVAPLEVLDVAISPPEERDGRILERRDYALAAFETGTLTVPSLSFEYVSAAGDTASIVSDSLTVVVESVLPEVKEGEEVGPKDIKGPIELPRRVWPYVAVVLAIAAALAALYYLRRWLAARRQRPSEEEAAEPPVPRRAAHLVAFERLRALERDDPIASGEITRFYVSVTEILRLYIRDRFGVDAVDMTTAELVPAMVASGIGGDEVDWAARFLSHADLAKFAKYVPPEERARSDFRSAWDFVDRTRFLGEEPDEEPESGAAESADQSDPSRGEHEPSEDES